MPEYAWLKEDMSGRGHIEMPVQKFVDWCQNRLNEIPEPERDSAMLLIEVVDYEMASIQIAVLYTPVDVASNDADVQAARRELEKEANFRPFSEFKNELDGGNDTGGESK